MSHPQPPPPAAGDLQGFANLIYAAALRQSRDEHAARDIAQAVFLIALQKAHAGKLPEESRMAGWLLKITHFAVKESRRREKMRSRHEPQAATMKTQSAAPDPDQETLLAALDHALLKLPSLDRELLARRYLQNQSVNHLAAALNIPENTASQRLHRALEKLRKLLTRQNLPIPAAALTTLMLAETTKAVPISLLTAATTLTAASANAAAIAKGATAMMKLATFKLAAAAVGVLLFLTISGGLLVHELEAQAAAPTAISPPASPIPDTAAAPSATNPASTAATAPAPTSPEAEKLLDLALATIAEQQESIKNLTATGVLKQEELDQRTGTWNVTYERDATATYAGVGAQRCCIECRLSKTPWLKGAAPYWIEKYTLAYDGEIALKYSEPDPPPPWTYELRVTAGRPHEIDDIAGATGWTCSTLGWRTFTNDMKKEISFLTLVNESRKLPRFRAAKVTQGDREFLRIIVPDTLPKIMEQHFWLDIRKNFALARTEYQFIDRDAQGMEWTRKLSQTDVTAFYEPVTGIFFPKHIDTQSFSGARVKEPPLVGRTAIDISDVKANTAVNDDAFRPEKVDPPELPENMRIEDGTPGFLFHGTLEEQQRQLEQLVEQVRAQATKENTPETRPQKTAP